MELRDGFVDEIKSIIEQSRVKAIRSVDHIRVKMYWELCFQNISDCERTAFTICLVSLQTIIES
jgi:hypothetical protein